METIDLSSPRHHYYRRLFFSTFCVVVLGALCVAAGLYALFPSELGTGYGTAIMTLRSIKHMLLPRAAGVFAVMTGLLVLAISLLHLIYSHRIAGPALQLGSEAERIGRGDLAADFHLRTKDNLTDLADTLKQAAHQYRDKVITMERHVAHLEEKAGALAALQHGGADQAALASTLHEMTATVRKVDKLLSEIRT